MHPRGQLRVLIGAAPGVGKTYAMLEEGRTLRSEGRDVAAGIIETHGRQATQAMCDGIEIIPRRTVEHRDVELHEMDLDAVLARHPEVALIDELAHTNAPGSRNDKRWQDVDELLDAGIDVISTVNIQHIASLNDVVEKITGISQQETIPDDVIRQASQIEVIDLDPQGLRKRLSDGLVYPAERIDAALSNYFRIGNLTALRELALLWLADEVDQALATYREANHIDENWEARERVVVAITGGAESETLLRRGARIAARSSGGKLLAVHVSTQDGLRSPRATNLTTLRSLTEQLGGSYHQVVGDDIPTELIEFAKSADATQLVLGTSRRSPLINALTGGTVSSHVLREAGKIDVHLVSHTNAKRLILPHKRGSLSLQRRLAGFFLTVVGFPLLTWLLFITRSPESITVDVLAYQLLVVIIALVGGMWPALLAALLSGVTLDFLFIEPYYTTTISDGYHLLALLIYIAVAILVSFVVDQAARKTRIARRAAAESELLQTVAGNVLRGQGAIQALVDRAYEAFSLERVELLHNNTLLAAAGDAGADEELTRIELGDGNYLEFYGADLSQADQRLLSIITAQLDAILEHQQLSETARELEPVAASDRLRGALLSALSHDLRRPLASATAAVTGLRGAGKSLTDNDKAELIATADESLQSLSSLVQDLLDVTRINTGAIKPLSIETDPGAVVISALDELDAGPNDIEISIDTGASVLGDPALLQRIIVNLLDNALRYTPPTVPVRIAISSFRNTIDIRVIDKGPGVPEAQHSDMFTPFQRTGDTDNTTGLGLGLALSKGFTEAMSGSLTAETTPGGGLTMVLTLPTHNDKQG